MELNEFVPLTTCLEKGSEKDSRFHIVIIFKILNTTVDAKIYGNLNIEI